MVGQEFDLGETSEEQSLPAHRQGNKQEFLLRSALEKTGLVQVLQCTVTPEGAKALCRLTEGTGGVWNGDGGFIHHLLRTEGDWSTHICQSYVLKGQGGTPKALGRLAFCWVVSIASPNIAKVLPEFITNIQGFRARAEASTVRRTPDPIPQSQRDKVRGRVAELTEMRLVGVRGEEINPDAENRGMVRLSNGKPPWANKGV